MRTAEPGGEECLDGYLNGIARAEAEKELLAAGTAHARTEWPLRGVGCKRGRSDCIGENVRNVEMSPRLEEGREYIYAPILAACENEARSRPSCLDAEHVEHRQAAVDFAVDVFRSMVVLEELEDVTG